MRSLGDEAIPAITQPILDGATGKLHVRDPRPSQLMAVLSWELRRVLASRASWVVALGTFGASFLLIATAPQSVDWLAVCCSQRTDTNLLAWTTPWALAAILPQPMLLVGLFLPFIATDGVARDLKRRTHELLMTTSVPTRSYLIGRYLASVLLSLGVACVLLLAVVVMALAQHLIQPARYPALDVPDAVVIWAIIALSPTLLLSSRSFALGAFLPRRSNVIKAGILFDWFACGVLLPQYMQHLVQTHSPVEGVVPSWYTAYVLWDPTSAATGNILITQFFHRLAAALRDPSLSDAAFLRRVLAVAHQSPDLTPFLGPHLVWAIVGLGIVALATVAFRRFRGVIG